MPAGWLAPSLQHRVETTMSWVERLRGLAPVVAISTELARFDTQALVNPEISEVEYQQGELAGYEVREYLLEKFNRTCAYCGAKNRPLEIEHVVPRSKGGSDRVSNLTLAGKPEVLARLRRQLKAPLKDAAAVNATRWALLNRLKATGLPVEAGTGGRTKYNRARQEIPKSHALDAACVGVVGTVQGWQQPILGITAMGRGSYQRTRLNRYGFPRAYLIRRKQVKGFQTGDLVRAEVPAGKKAGVHVGRVAVRATGSFNIGTAAGVVQAISHRHCKVLQRGDGYGYQLKPGGGVSSPA